LDAGTVNCLGPGADMHMAQLMPLPLTVSCFSKIIASHLSKVINLNLLNVHLAPPLVFNKITAKNKLVSFSFLHPVC